MSKVWNHIYGNLRIIVEKAVQFLAMVLFINIFQKLFGSEHVLSTVAVGVGLFMLPFVYNGVKPFTTAMIILFLYPSAALIAQLALVSPWIALPINFVYVILIFALTCEPAMLQSSISFILCFVFSQSAPVPAELLPQRFLCMLTGAGIVAVTTLIYWKKNGYGEHGRTLKEQVKVSMKNHNYILRMAAGLSIAMFIGMSLGVKRPLWISIVVMSLTQISYQDTIQRMKHRFVSTVLGASLFTILFGLIVPEKYVVFVILFLSYLGNFATQYRYKQIVNAVCALNASMALLSIPMALLNRGICLLIGIIIVLLMWKLDNPFTLLYEKLHALYLKAVMFNDDVDAGSHL